MKAGFGRCVITPQKPMLMAGFDRRTEPSDGILDELYVSVLLLKDNADMPFAFCSFDLLGVDSQLCQLVRTAVNNKIGLCEECIWISATHTHSAPSHIYWGRDSYDPTYVSHIVSCAAEAAEAAMIDLQPCEAQIAYPYVVGVASLRNQGRSGASYPMPLYVTKLIRQNDSLSFCLFSCHPTVLDEKNRRYCKDIPGAAAMRLPEEQHCLFFNGACADLSTRFTRTASNYEELLRIGGIMGDAIAMASYEAAPDFGVRIGTSQEDIFLSRGASLDGAERLSLLTALREIHEACDDPQMRREYDSRIAVLERDSVAAEKDRKIRIAALDFGPFMLASLPFEVDSKDGCELECLLTAEAQKPVYLLCYTGGYDGYLPSGKPLSVNSSYEDFASRYLPESRRQVWESAKQCVRNAKI